MRRIEVLALIVFTAAAMAQPSPRLRDLNSFAGTWTCNGKAFATPWGPEHPTTATIHVVWDLGAYWLHADYAEKKTASNPHPAAGHVYWGWDELEKKFAGHFVNNFGGHEVIASDGWHGDTIIWTGQMNTPQGPMATRDTFVRKSGREITHTTEAQMKGAWSELDAETCKKK